MINRHQDKKNVQGRLWFAQLVVVMLVVSVLVDEDDCLFGLLQSTNCLSSLKNEVVLGSFFFFFFRLSSWQRDIKTTRDTSESHTRHTHYRYERAPKWALVCGMSLIGQNCAWRAVWPKAPIQPITAHCFTQWCIFGFIKLVCVCVCQKHSFFYYPKSRY